MAKTAKAAEAKTEVENVITETVKNVQDAVKNVQEKIAVPAAAREFVARQAATAKERAETAHETAAKFNTNVEKAAVSFIGRYAAFNKGLIDMAAANVSHALVTVEKVSQAKSLSDAMQIQADYVRESAKANYDRVRDAAEVAKETVSEAAAAVRENAAKVWPYGNKAA